MFIHQPVVVGEPVGYTVPVPVTYLLPVEVGGEHRNQIPVIPVVEHPQHGIGPVAVVVHDIVLHTHIIHEQEPVLVYLLPPVELPLAPVNVVDVLGGYPVRIAPFGRHGPEECRHQCCLTHSRRAGNEQVEPACTVAGEPQHQTVEEAVKELHILRLRARGKYAVNVVLGQGCLQKPLLAALKYRIRPSENLLPSP